MNNREMPTPIEIGDIPSAVFQEINLIRDLEEAQDKLDGSPVDNPKMEDMVRQLENMVEKAKEQSDRAISNKGFSGREEEIRELARQVEESKESDHDRSYRHAREDMDIAAKRAEHDREK